MVLIAMSSVGRGEKPAMFHSDLWWAIGWEMGEAVDIRMD
jgi:hypothetical protein